MCVCVCVCVWGGGNTASTVSSLSLSCCLDTHTSKLTPNKSDRVLSSSTSTSTTEGKPRVTPTKNAGPDDITAAIKTLHHLSFIPYFYV